MSPLPIPIGAFGLAVAGPLIAATMLAGVAPRAYKAGESFVEPPGSEHLVSENASATEPASLLVADDGAQLTIFDK
jgi:hypothetical protein